jgi:hypothetical protein
MESDILNVLKFVMGNPTTKTFLRYITKQINQKNVAPILVFSTTLLLTLFSLFPCPVVGFSSDLIKKIIRR